MCSSSIHDSLPNSFRIWRLLFCWFIIDALAAHGLLLAQTSSNTDDKTNASRATRQPWTASGVIGSPDQPLALGIEPAFPNLKFTDPMHIRWQEDVGRYFVCELGGKIWSFPHDEQVRQADLVVDFKADLKSFDATHCAGCENCYSLVFDPDFAKNRFVYVCLILKSKTGKPLEDGSRISRFRVTEESPPRIDLSSELPVITWLAGGHNGCDLAFDRSGCLLISTGDATEPSPPDRLATGQDITDLLASILRVDVRGATKDAPYRIPDDNPFRDLAGAKPEVWAFGFRNPWRISVDPPTGQLWLGDVGWEKWELVHRVQRGGNYGWSVREGNELLQPSASKGPGPILPTRIAISHADAASVTGGFVYRGRKLSAISGQYIFGDWITGRIWAVPLDDDSPHTEVASGQLRIIAFAPDRDGEPLVVNHFNGTTMFRLTANKDYERQLKEMKRFPRLLSQTGIFEDVVSGRPAPGVRPFPINAPQWQDGAVGSRYLCLPGTDQVTVYNEPQPVGSVAMFNSRLHYPAGAVLAKTITLPAVQSRAEQRIETQLLHFDGRLWRGYSYLWNADQSDAELVRAEGQEITLPERGGQRWRVHSRTECMQCHNPWPETTLAFTPEQLHDPSRGEDSEWIKLHKQGFVKTIDKQKREIDPVKCVRKALVVDPNDAVTSRARAYLHANCSHCHQNGAGAAVDVSLRIQDEGAALKALDTVPLKGGFGITDSKVIARGDAARSALIYRMASSSIGRMPHIGSREVDFQAVAVVAKWIDKLQAASATGQTDQRSMAERAAQLIDDLARAVGEKSDNEQLRSRRLHAAVRLAVDLAEARPTASSSQPEKWVAQLAQSADPIISSLFEAHLPTNARQRRLNPDATYADVADLVGDAARGKSYFMDTTRSQCSKCHRVGETGGQVGPALNEIGKKSSPAQLFEALADPSRVIDPKFQTQLLVTGDGKVVSGLLVRESKDEVVLVNAQGEQVTIAANDIDTRRTDTKSLMPVGLATEMTAQQMADLLAYLSSLR